MVQLESIDFSQHYVKLYCDDGGIFTTIRRYSADNIKKYLNQEGNIYTITINGQYVFDARLLSVMNINHVYDLSMYLLVYDSMYYPIDKDNYTENGISDITTKYGDAPVMLLILQKVTEDDVQNNR